MFNLNRLIGFKNLDNNKIKNKINILDIENGNKYYFDI